MKEIYVEIGKLIHELYKEEEYFEISNSGDLIELSGYNGYEAFRYSDVEKTKKGKRLIKLFSKLSKN